jgi:hypothetical protein
MVSLVFQNAANTYRVEYLCDIVSASQATCTIYQIKQMVSGVESVISNTGGSTVMNATLVGYGFPDSVREIDKATLVALAHTLNWNLYQKETGQVDVTLHAAS